MATYNNNNAMRAVTSRFSLSDYMALLAEAERTGSNPSQLLRQAWQVYQEQHDGLRFVKCCPCDTSLYCFGAGVDGPEHIAGVIIGNSGR